MMEVASRGGGGGGGVLRFSRFVAAGCVRPGGGVANALVGPAVVAAKRGAGDVECGRQGWR